MRILKIILSVAALLANAIALVLASGVPFQVPAQVLFLVQSVFGGIGILGISPIDLPDPVKRLCRAVAAIGAGIMGVHAGSVGPVSNPHPWLWAAFGLLVAVVGVLGKSLISHAAPAPAAAPAIPPELDPDGKPVRPGP